ncbi:MAG: glycosyltransferase [Candidatus Nanoarchaeia archaeon]
MKLSLCLIVKNEEGDLPRCLTAAAGVVDEIIVVDTGSNDKTKAIAKEFGAKVFDFEWRDDFSAARNESLKHATGDWILVLDADEAIFKGDLRKLKEFLPKAEAEGFILETRNYTNETNLSDWRSSRVVDGFEGYIPSFKIRLFRNKGYVFENKVHESVEESIRKKEGKLQHIEDVVVHHYGYSSGKSKYIEMLENTEGKSIGQLYDLGATYLSAGDFPSALKTFLEVCEKDDSFRYVQRNLGTLFLKAKEMSKAGEHLKKAIEQRPSDSAAYNNLGVAFKQLRKYDQAAKCFSKCANLQPKDPRPLRSLALVYADQGEKEKAKELLEKALKAFPGSRILQETLAIL